MIPNNLGRHYWSVLFLVSLAGATLHAGTELSGVAQNPDPKEAKAIPAILASNGSLKPDWLSEASINLKEGYDSNVYLVDHGSNTGVSSWFTSVTPKVALNMIPFLGLNKGDETVKTFSLSYAPEIVQYYDAPREDNTAHRFALKAAGKIDNFSYGLDEAFTYVDGDSQSWTNVPGGQVGTPALIASRERRDQFQDRIKGFVRYDKGDWFLRPTSSFQWWDLHTAQGDTTTGYINYVDRYDVCGGIDVGYKPTKTYDLYLGYRYGRQFQGVENSGFRASNDYQRLLVGIEGKPVKWLTLDLQAGPDFRSYDMPNAPMNQNLPKTIPFYDASATVDMTADDALLLRAKRFGWVSQLGITAYTDQTYCVTYRRKITDKLSGTLGFQALDSDFAYLAGRDDWEYSYMTGLQYVLDPHWSFGADYSFNRGENGYNQINVSREFQEHLLTMNVKWNL